MEQHVASIETDLRSACAGEFHDAYQRGATMSAIEAATFITQLDTQLAGGTIRSSVPQHPGSTRADHRATRGEQSW
jgi:hypothetical protein